MTIEFVNESDIQKIYDISKCYFDWTYDNFVSGLKSNNIFLKAVSEEKIVGFLIADDLIDSYNLLLIAVREEFKNQNIATKLIKKLENIAKNKNIEKIWLEVKENNFPAINLYKKNDFTNIYLRRNYYKSGENALIFEKLI